MIGECFINYINQKLLRHIFGLKTVKETWCALKQYFLSISKSRIIQLRQDLIKMKKWGLSVNNYILELKELSDQLESTRYTLF